jgi:hypothetical protein
VKIVKTILFNERGGIPVVDLGRFIEWIKNAAVDVFKWLIMRAFVISVVMTLVPMAIYLGWSKIAQYIFEAASDQAGTGGIWDGAIITYTGLGAWLATAFKLPECMSLLLGAMSVRFVLSFIRR